MAKFTYPALCIVSLIFSSLAMAENGVYNGPAFSAQELNYSKFDRNEVDKSKVYYSKDGNRSETEGPFGSEILIVNYQQKKAWRVIPSKKWIMEMPLDAAGNSTAPALPPGMNIPIPMDEEDVDVSTLYDEKPCLDFDLTKKLGTESINGRQTEKWACGKSRTRRESMQWFDPKLKMVIKEEMDSGDINELKNIKLGAQPASLFQPPKGYRKLTQQQYMQEMMRQMQRGMMQK